MTTHVPTRRDVQLLVGEARRYLAAVDTFRAEGREPTWLPERDAPAAKARKRRPVVGVPPIP